MDKQVLKGMDDDLHPRCFSQRPALGLDHRHAFLEREERALVAVDGDADHQPVDEAAGPAEDVDVSERDRIEGARIKPNPHHRPPG